MNEPILAILPEDEEEDPVLADFYRFEMEHHLAPSYRRWGLSNMINAIHPIRGMADIHIYANELCMVKTLIRLGADVNLLDLHGHSPIYHAIHEAGPRWNHEAAPAVKYLLEHGADPNVMLSDDTPIWQSSEYTNEQLKCFLHLIAHGADTRNYIIPMWLRPYLALMTMCIPIDVPRSRKAWLPKDLIRRLRLFLI